MRVVVRGFREGEYKNKKTTKKERNAKSTLPQDFSTSSVTPARPAGAMSILKGLLTAREGSYFKLEQEDDLSAYRKRRIREGALSETGVHLLEGNGQRELFPGWEKDKLAAIHAQEARVSPSVRAARLRVSSQMPPTSTQGASGRLDRSFAGTHKVPSTRGAVWEGFDAVRASREANKSRVLLPEESAAMRKTKAVADKALVAGTRALVYGSLIAVSGVAGGGLLVLTWLDVRDAHDVRKWVLTRLGPSVAAAKTRVAPIKTWLESCGLGTTKATDGVTPSHSGKSAVRWIEDSAIVQDLRGKFRARRNGEDGGTEAF